jgi:transposase
MARFDLTDFEWSVISPLLPNWADTPERNLPAFSSYLYRYRNLVERFFNKIKHHPSVATRYDKRPENFLAALAFLKNQDPL